MSSTPDNGPNNGKRPHALELGPRKKPSVIGFIQCNSYVNSLLNSRCTTDPLVHHGRHFGRTIHALCNIHTLINNGILRLGELADQPEEAFTAE